jgi:nucleotide-binding universal stress UspA family protein
MFERILIPLDGSARGELILSQVGRILRREDSQVLLLRVLDVPPILRDLETVPFLLKEREEAEKYIHELERRLSGQGAKVRGRVKEGPASAAILEAAREENATMIAMTTHGRGGLARWVMGSVAEKVARASDVPILIVRSFREASHGDVVPVSEQELPFRRILVPVDGSPTSMGVIEAAEEFARLFGSEVLVLHVWPLNLSPVYVAPGVPVFSTDPASIFPTPTPEKDEMTAQAAERFRRAGLQVTRMSTSGDAASEILDLSLAKGVDLVAIGTHGRSGVSRWVLGSVAERVLRHARTPVLLVRPHSPEGHPGPERKGQ